MGSTPISNNAKGVSQYHPRPSFTKAYYPLSRVLSANRLLSLYLSFTEIVFTMVITRLSLLKALLSKELGSFLVSAQ